MMITQTPQTAAPMLSYSEAEAQSQIDLYNGNGITDGAARAIADAFKSPNTPALVALAQGTSVDSEAVQDEAQAEYNYIRRHPHTDEADLVTVTSLIQWAIDYKG